ncbi:type VII secretion protein EccE [Mycolicibacterium arenosum]|uniref:Type VII secretion protein EccE n=1 Tax=Mycolicibacterium arenosum TaxID=2952157 RepID=A0ABT1MET8_9MYCO|nr:type VII secretion protein EccE [Mycolicibacterium sp. CAU 1645]MCP9276917.1 type VII secretion protein EccE [Mycolicibacterium sp. CAU 1645]
MTVTIESLGETAAPATDSRRRADERGRLPRWQLRFPLRRVVIAETVAAVAALALVPFAPWWASGIVAAVIVLFSTVTYREASASRWLGRWRTLRRMRSPRRRAARAAIAQPFTVELPSVGTIGMRWDDGYAITVIALHGRPHAESRLVSEGAQTTDLAPLEVCGALLEQFGGLELESVDLVSAGARTAADGAYTPRYVEIIADRSAVGIRRTWLVLRLRPQGCLDAMSYRGSVAEAAAAATERIRQAAAARGCRAVTCSAEQITEATAALLDGHDLAAYTERWSELRVGDDSVNVYRIAGRDLTTRLLSDLWTIRATKTVVLLRLTRDTEDGELLVAALVRVHTAAPQPHPPISPLHTVPLQGFAGLAATLPLGARSLELDLPARPLAARPLDVPVGPAGFLHGMDEREGTPYLISWTDPLKFVHVAIAANLDVVQSLILRATAAGATAEIHTDRTRSWEPIRDHTRIRLGQPGVRSDAVTLIVADGAAPRQALSPVGERGRALVTVVGPGEPMPENADIRIQQTATGHITVMTPVRTGEITLGIMRPRNEAQSLTHLRTAGGPRS